MNDLESLATLIRYYCLISTTKAGSGHPSSSLSATDLMTVLLFGGFFHFDVRNPHHVNNDRLIFSKGHASPLFYALWAAAGQLTKAQLLRLRKFNSKLEGHPTMAFPYTEAATGSLGQGLSIGMGMALNAKYIDKVSYKTFVLLGDSEMAEGSQWEAIQLAAYYKLDNLIGIIDVNRLGQRGATMYGHRLKEYEKRIAAFGWKTILINGHSISAVTMAYRQALRVKNRPVMIIARTIKGRGVKFIENKEGWHGKALTSAELQKALKLFGTINYKMRGAIPLPEDSKPVHYKIKSYQVPAITKSMTIATRKAYGQALVRHFPKFSKIVALDAEVSNSTYANDFSKAYPDRFFEMFVAEQNMIGTALGLAHRGKIPFVSTFAAFFTRAHDQIRMSQYSDSNIKFVGSHAGVSIGEDGASQMGLEDIAMFRSLHSSTVLYPSDGISADKSVALAAKHKGLVYIRTTRGATPVLYSTNETFSIGSSKVLRQSKNDVATVVAAGITLHQSLKAYEQLRKNKKYIRVIDLYSVKPLDMKTLRQAARETQAIITVEDHYPEGGIGEAVTGALAQIKIPVHIMAVRKMPKSGTSDQLLDFEDISTKAIVSKIKSIIK